MKKLIFALIAGAAAMTAAQAQTTAPHAYIGVGAASADHSYSLPGATNVSSDGYKASGKVFGGYDIDQTWGVEAGYTDFRKSGADYTLNGNRGHAESSGHSVYVAAKVTAPVSDQFSIYGKVGAANNKRTLTATDPVLNRDANKTELYAGVGAEYKLNQNVGLIAEYERYGKSKDFGAKSNVLTVGAKYNF